LKINNKSKFLPQQREQIDLRSIRLRRTPDTEKREKEEIERFVESVKAERGKEAQLSEGEIPPSEEMEMEEKGEKEITPPRREEIDLQSIRMRRTPDTEDREKVEIERFVESIKRERERMKEHFTPEEELPPPPLDEPAPKEEPPQPADEPLPPIDKPLLSEKEIGFPEEVDQIVVRLKTKSDVENIKPDVKNVELGMTPDEVIKVAGSPRYIIEWYTGNLKYNYGNVWVVIENGVVTCLVRSKHVEEYWGKSDYERKNPKAIIK